MLSEYTDGLAQWRPAAMRSPLIRLWTPIAWETRAFVARAHLTLRAGGRHTNTGEIPNGGLAAGVAEVEEWGAARAADLGANFPCAAGEGT